MDEEKELNFDDAIGGSEGGYSGFKADYDNDLSTGSITQTDGYSDFWTAFNSSESEVLNGGSSESISFSDKTDSQPESNDLSTISIADEEVSKDKRSDLASGELKTAKSGEGDSLVKRLGEMFKEGKDAVKGAYGDFDSEGKKFVWGAALGLFKTLASSGSESAKNQTNLIQANAYATRSKAEVDKMNRQANALAQANALIAKPVAAPYQYGLVQNAMNQVR